MNEVKISALALALALAACGETPEGAPDAAADGQIDATPDAPPAVGRWTTAEPIIELASATDDRFPSLAVGGHSIYFTRTEMIGSFVVNVPYTAVRASLDLPFGVPYRPVTWGASSIFDQEHSSDHIEWFFWRALGQLGTSARASTGDPWSFPSDLGVDGFSPSLSGDGLSLYFVDFNGELAVMTRPDRASAWSAPAVVPVAGEISIAQVDVSGDERTLLISSDPASASAGIYLATRGSTSEAFAEPVAIPELAGPYRSARFREGETEIVCELELGGDFNVYRSLYISE